MGSEEKHAQGEETKKEQQRTDPAVKEDWRWATGGKDSMEEAEALERAKHDEPD